MGNAQNGRFPFPRVSRLPGLPPGVRQADCDGRADDLADADADRLWNACRAYQQDSVSSRFIQLNAEGIRDLLLDAQDAFGAAATSTDDAPGKSLGRPMWTMWITYRDRTLREMARRGELSPI